MVKKLYLILLCLIAAAVCLFLAAFAVVRQPRFGTPPQGERLARIEGSRHYRDGQFRNLIPTPKFSQDINPVSMIRGRLFDKPERLVPDAPIPVEKTDLKALPPDKNAVVWMGHSSWFIQVSGKRILIDPIFSGYASPFFFMNKAFPGTTIYTAEDMPGIDCLLISHEHWDHLDYEAVTALESKVKQVITPLGVGGYFEYWGYPEEKIREGDWYDGIELDKDFTVHVLPARHYSNRLFKENRTLWAGFAIESPGMNIFYSGDSGCGPHFREIGKRFDGFDLVLLDCGQYDPHWAYIHMTPEEAVEAAGDLGARTLIPAHVGRFTIANHAWDDPFKRITEASRGKEYRLLTPRIGELMIIDENISGFSSWWAANGD